MLVSIIRIIIHLSTFLYILNDIIYSELNNYAQSLIKVIKL